MTIRRRLPNRRASETLVFLWNDRSFTATVSYFSDGRIASIALQYGAPLEVIRRALMRDPHGVASGPLGAALDLVAGNRGAAS